MIEFVRLLFKDSGNELISRKNAFSYVTNASVVVTNSARELLVASSDDLPDVEAFTSRSPKDRLEYFNLKEDLLGDDDKELYKKVKSTFLSPAGMRAVYGENGNLRLFFDEKSGKPYDIFYVKETFEELPQGAFSMKQRVITLLGPVNATKTTIAELWNMMMCDTFLENPCLNVELANRPGSPAFNRYCEISRRFSEGHIPERSHRGDEIQENSYMITYTNPVTGAKVQSLLQVKDMPGEDWQVLGFDSYVLNENRIPVIVIPMGDLIAKHEDQNYVSELDKYLMNYANKAKDVRLIKGYEPVKPIFIISNFDVAQTKLNNPEIEEIRNNGSSLVRDGKLRMSRHKNGLKLEYLRHVSRDLLLPFLRDYAGSILKRMQEICGEDEPMIFACAAIGQEPEKDKENGFIYPEGFVPFNLDEPLLYLLNREGMYPADSGEKGEEKNDRMLFWNILDRLTSMEYEDELI